DVPEQIGEDLLRRGVRKRLQDDARPAWRRGPVRLALEEVGARCTEDEHGSVFEVFEQVFDELQERALGPVNILEGDDERATRGQRDEQTPDSPEELLDRELLVREPDRGR